jgi:hypothetical protein
VQSKLRRRVSIQRDESSPRPRAPNHPKGGRPPRTGPRTDVRLRPDQAQLQGVSSLRYRSGGRRLARASAGTSAEDEVYPRPVDKRPPRSRALGDDPTPRSRGAPVTDSTHSAVPRTNRPPRRREALPNHTRHLAAGRRRRPRRHDERSLHRRVHIAFERVGARSEGHRPDRVLDLADLGAPIDAAGPGQVKS